MTDLDETLTQLRQRISRHREQPLGEQNTKAILIEPLLRGSAGTSKTSMKSTENTNQAHR